MTRLEVLTPVAARVPGWMRLLQYGALVLSVVLGWAGVLALSFGMSINGAFYFPERVPQTAMALYVLGLYVALLGGAWAIWRADGNAFSVKFSWRRLLEGWIIGLVGLVALTGFELATGLARIGPSARFDPTILLTAILVGTAYALSEETLFRGFMLGLLGRDFGRRGAMAITAFLFALGHFLHPVDVSQILIPFFGLWCAGALLASCRVRSGSLWLGIGVHSAWVWYVTASGQLQLLTFDSAGQAWTGGGSPASGLLGPLFLIPTYLWIRARHRA